MMQMQQETMGMETPKSHKRKIQLTDSGSKTQDSPSPSDSLSSLIEQTLGYRVDHDGNPDTATGHHDAPTPHSVYNDAIRNRNKTSPDRVDEKESMNDTLVDTTEDLLARFTAAFENEQVSPDFDEEFPDDRTFDDHLEDGSDGKVDKIKVLSALLDDHKSRSEQFLVTLANYQVFVVVIWCLVFV